MRSIDLAKKIARLAWEKQAQDIRILDLRGLTSATDFFVVCTGHVDMQVKSITDFIQRELKPRKIKPFSVEGRDHYTWVLMDYVDVLVHCFLPEHRERYNLEGLWADALSLKVDDATGKVETLKAVRQKRTGND